MANYCPHLVEDLTTRLNAMTGVRLTQNDTFRLLESVREQYGLPDPFDAFVEGLEAACPGYAQIVSGPAPPMVEAGPGPYRYEPKTPLPEFTFRPLMKDAPLTHDEALTRLHTMRPADPAFTRTYLGDAS